MINTVMQRLATDGYINSGTGGTGGSHVPLAPPSRGQVSVQWRQHPLHQAVGPVNSTESQCGSYLAEAALFLHVLLDGLPNATLGEEGAAGGQLKLLVAAVSLQGELHDAHRLPGEGGYVME